MEFFHSQVPVVFKIAQVGFVIWIVVGKCLFPNAIEQNQPCNFGITDCLSKFSWLPICLLLHVNNYKC